MIYKYVLSRLVFPVQLVTVPTPQCCNKRWFQIVPSLLYTYQSFRYQPLCCLLKGGDTCSWYAGSSEGFAVSVNWKGTTVHGERERERGRPEHKQQISCPDKWYLLLWHTVYSYCEVLFGCVDIGSCATGSFPGQSSATGGGKKSCALPGRL